MNTTDEILSKIVDLRDWANSAYITILQYKFDISLIDVNDIHSINELYDKILDEQNELNQINNQIAQLSASLAVNEKNRVSELTDLSRII